MTTPHTRVSGLISTALVTALLSASAPAGAQTAPAPATPAQCTDAAGLTTLTLNSGGRSRVALLYRPAGVPATARLPVILTLHGSQSNASEQLARSDLQRVADAQGVLIVAPQGIIPAGQGETGPGYSWAVPYVSAPQTPPVDDEAFLTELIGTLVSGHCADPARVYATGYSGGGRMISQYACDVPGKLAAVATVAGLRAGPPRKTAAGAAEPDPALCAPKQPVPIIAFQGTTDPVNPYAGGGAAYWQYSPKQAVARWAELNGCVGNPVITRDAPHVFRFAYEQCAGGVKLTSYIINGGGHTWPGSTTAFAKLGALGFVTTEINASDAIWAFFKDYRVSAP